MQQIVSKKPKSALFYKALIFIPCLSRFDGIKPGDFSHKTAVSNISLFIYVSRKQLKFHKRKNYKKGRGNAEVYPLFVQMVNSPIFAIL